MNDLTYTNIHGCNVLHICGANSDNDEALKEVIKYIMKQKSGEKLLQDLISAKTFDQQMTVLHLFSGKGFHKCLQVIMNTKEKYGMNIPLNERDSNGHTALVMCCANGFIDCVRLLISEPDINIYIGDARCKTCLYYATFNQLEEIVDLILDCENKRGEEYRIKYSEEQRKLVELCDSNGNSCLHIACLKGSISLFTKLVESGANLIATSISGDSCLHICCQRNYQKHHELLQYFVDNCENDDIIDLMKKTTSFGCTPLHDSAYCGNWKALEILHNGREKDFLKCLEICDNDGLTPILSLCRGIVTYNAKNFKRDDLLKSLDLILSFNCNPNGGDFAKSTCLHFLCYGSPDDDIIMEAIQILLKYNADPTLEDTFGWSPLHAVYQTGKGELAKEIFETLKNHVATNCKNSKYLDTFDPKKERNLKDRTFVDKAGPHNRIPIEERNAVLQGDFTIQGISSFIKRKLDANESLKIVVLVGAGISVNCGIPDFRSPGKGIYSKINPNQFSLEYLAKNPKEFYGFVNEMFGPVFNGNVKPSDTHLFLKLLNEKGLLQRVYTQNIDTVESLAGIDENLLIHAHGSFSSARCVSCVKPVEEMKANFWNPIFNDQVPLCSNCNQIVRPDVIFFGESLPPRFFEFQNTDLKSADLLIIMGTSLVVYPFASLVNMVPLLTPRLLINKEPTGPFTKRTSATYRDAVYLGDCDAGVNELIESLGWTEEFNTVKETYNKA